MDAKPQNSKADANSCLLRAIRMNLEGRPFGVYSICSAHPYVLRAAMRQALQDECPVCIESTSNQVNQFGGYTGLTAAGFAHAVTEIASAVGFPEDKIILGGDHLGPYVWRGEPAAGAMDKARELVRSYVQAGYRKIHLDTSMACADDPTDSAGGLREEVVTARAANLCQAAEQARRDLPSGGPEPLYVIGTEVPVPGGERAGAAGPDVTRGEDVERTLFLSRTAFRQMGLNHAWERVIGLVVQPGVEFGDADIFPYERAKTRRLTEFIGRSKQCVFEAHSTDYQTPDALNQMVEDHFAILKVGPWLTFAFREAVSALAWVEKEWLGSRPGAVLSNVMETIEEAMVRDPGDWQSYYRGDEAYVRYARAYSYSDRSRYYWVKPEVQAALTRLIDNLSARGMPMPLLSQFMSNEYEAVRAGLIHAQPQALIERRIRAVLQVYSKACRSAELGRQTAGQVVAS